MAEKILMPRLSDTMTEGVIAEWHKNVGDTVKKGDLLAEIETDKATMELESYWDGVILHLGVPKGGKLKVDDLLTIIGNQGEDISGLLNGAAAVETQTPASAPAPETPAAQPAVAAAAPSNTLDISQMDEVVLMPRLSDTMTEGVIASWLKQVGEPVKKGDVLAEIETDKATMELESYKNGTLLYQGAKAGEKIQVNDLLCIIGDASKINVDDIVAASKGGVAVTTVAAEQPTAADSNSSAATTTNTAGSTTTDGRVKASPLAKKIASEKGIDISLVKGTGDGGRIIKADIDNYKPAAAPAASAEPAKPAASATAPATTVTADNNSYTDVPVSQMRKVIAKRLAESLFTAPHFFLTMAIDMDNAIATRTKLNEISKVKISFNDMVLKAVAVALRQHPAINSSWLGDTIRVNKNINIGVAVAVEDGLLVPVVRNADNKSFSQIAVEVKEFAQKAKDKKLQPADWEGNTFTISNLGMFGIDEFTAIINPPDSCILAIGGISKVPVVKNDAVVPGNVMKVTLSCDHRVVDGATGSAFLQTLKGLLEDPVRILI